MTIFLLLRHAHSTANDAGILAGRLLLFLKAKALQEQRLELNEGYKTSRSYIRKKQF